MGGASQELEYDARGRITGIVDGNGNRTKYLLDEWGRITGVVKADGSTERYTYNFAGDMVSSTDGEGRMLTVLSPEGQVFQTNTYCAKGHVVPIAKYYKN